MNILITAPHLDSKKNISGISSVVSTILSNREHNYFHFCAGKKDGEKGGISWLFKFAKNIIKFPFYLKRKKIDLLHLSVPFDKKGLFREFIFAAIGRCANKKVIAHFHGGVYFSQTPKNWIMKLFIDQFFSLCTHIVVLSEIEKRTIQSKFRCPKPITILSNCIDPIVKSTEIEDVIKNKEKNSFIYIGRITKEKGIIDLVHSLKLIEADQIQLKLVLCGTGPEEEWACSELSSLSNIVLQFEGVVSGEKKNNLLKKAEYFILPSHFEGLPISLLEAMSAGCVPISTNVGAVNTLIENNLFGYLVEPQNIDSMSNGIKMAIKNGNSNPIISKNVSSKVENNYNCLTYIHNLNNLYKNINL